MLPKMFSCNICFPVTLICYFKKIYKNVYNLLPVFHFLVAPPFAFVKSEKSKSHTF